jgi:hypothetical protein
MTAVAWIRASDLERWSDSRAAQAELPQLVRLLVRGTVDRPRRVDFRAGESVRLPGWDGLVETEVGNEWVPDGRSAWELGTSADPRDKAQRDYRSRTDDPLGVDRSTTAYVALSSRLWPDKRAWAEEKQREGIWREVRAYDADDIEQWCEAAPSARVWLCGVLGLRADGVSTLEEFWAEWVAGTEPRIDPPVVLAGRGDVASQLLAWIAGPPSPLTVVAGSPEESVVFAVAALLSAEGENGEHARARAVVVSDLIAWHTLLRTRHGLVLIPCKNVDRPAVLLAASNGHHSLLPMHGTGVVAAPSVRVPRLSPEPLERELLRLGVSRERAIALSRGSGQSALVLRRQLSGTPAVFEPRWAEVQNARALVPALLVGAWNGAREHDCDAVAKLGRPYREVLDTAVRWSTEPDSPLRLTNDVWRWVSREDAWRLLARMVARDDLDAFEQLALEVLGESDPRFDLPLEERWMANIREAVPRASSALRQGLAETVALLGARGFESGMHVSLNPGARAERIVRELLSGHGWRAWAQLAEALTQLAEAAPDVFLGAVRTLSDDDARTLFEQEQELGGSPHCHLLWALEMFAWHPQYLTATALSLARLARVDPGGRIANRPLKSLETILVGWLPQTRAPLDQRVQTVETVLQREPRVGWQLLTELMSAFGSSSSMNIHRPRWRDWDSGWEHEHGITNREHDQWVREICRLALEHVGDDGVRWSSLVKRLAELPAPLLESALSGLEQRCERFDEAGKFEVWQALRDVLHHHLSFPEADWAMPGDVLTRLESIYQSLEPTDVIQRFGWLFTSWPRLPEKEGGSWQDELGARTRARANAAEEILRAGGVALALQVSREVEQPFSLGWAIGARDDASAHEPQMLRDALQADDAAQRELGRGFVVGRFSRAGWEWASRTLREFSAGPASQLVRIACCLPFEPTTWDSLARIGVEVDALYWREIETRRLLRDERETAQRAITKLLEAGRPYAALFIAGSAVEHTTFECALPPELLATTLERVARTDPGDERPTVPANAIAHEIQQVLGALAVAGFDRTRVALLEWEFLPLLRHKPHRPKVLYGELASSPHLFAEVIEAAFQSDDESDRTEWTPDVAERAKRAWDLLRMWNQIPGSAPGQEIDANALREWVTEARRLCVASRRARSGDLKIGELLAKAPPGADGVWPPLAVREVIETENSPRMQDGLRVGAFNRRGSFWRVRERGGDQERALAGQYRDWAAQIAGRWPITAEILRTVAAGYESDAHREDGRDDD